MQANLPLLYILLASLAVACVCCGSLWAAWLAPHRIRAAVANRQGPRQIRASVSTSFGYWLLLALVALVVSGVCAYLAYVYLGVWLYASLGGWQDHLATALSRTFLVWQWSAPDRDFGPLLPVGAILCVFVGVLAGAALGTRMGTVVAARRFLITRAMF